MITAHVAEDPDYSMENVPDNKSQNAEVQSHTLDAQPISTSEIDPHLSTSTGGWMKNLTGISDVCQSEIISISDDDEEDNEFQAKKLCFDNNYNWWNPSSSSFRSVSPTIRISARGAEDHDYSIENIPNNRIENDEVHAFNLYAHPISVSEIDPQPSTSTGVWTKTSSRISGPCQSEIISISDEDEEDNEFQPKKLCFDNNYDWWNPSSSSFRSVSPTIRIPARGAEDPDYSIENIPDNESENAEIQSFILYAHPISVSEIEPQPSTSTGGSTKSSSRISGACQSEIISISDDDEENEFQASESCFGNNYDGWNSVSPSILISHQYYVENHSQFYQTSCYGSSTFIGNELSQQLGYHSVETTYFNVNSTYSYMSELASDSTSMYGYPSAEEHSILIQNEYINSFTCQSQYEYFERSMLGSSIARSRIYESSNAMSSYHEISQQNYYNSTSHSYTNSQVSSNISMPHECHPPMQSTSRSSAHDFRKYTVELDTQHFTGTSQSSRLLELRSTSTNYMNDNAESDRIDCPGIATHPGARGRCIRDSDNFGSSGNPDFVPKPSGTYSNNSVKQQYPLENGNDDQHRNNKKEFREQGTQIPNWGVWGYWMDSGFDETDIDDAGLRATKCNFNRRNSDSTNDAENRQYSSENVNHNQRLTNGGPYLAICRHQGLISVLGPTPCYRIISLFIVGHGKEKGFESMLSAKYGVEIILNFVRTLLKAWETTNMSKSKFRNVCAKLCYCKYCASMVDSDDYSDGDSDGSESWQPPDDLEARKIREIVPPVHNKVFFCDIERNLKPCKKAVFQQPAIASTSGVNIKKRSDKNDSKDSVLNATKLFRSRRETNDSSYSDDSSDSDDLVVLKPTKTYTRVPMANANEAQQQLSTLDKGSDDQDIEESSSNTDETPKRCFRKIALELIANDPKIDAGSMYAEYADEYDKRTLELIEFCWKNSNMSQSKFKSLCSTICGCKLCVLQDETDFDDFIKAIGKSNPNPEMVFKIRKIQGKQAKRERAKRARYVSRTKDNRYSKTSKQAIFRKFTPREYKKMTNVRVSLERLSLNEMLLYSQENDI